MILAPWLGRQLKILLSNFASLNPSAIACATRFQFFAVFRNETMEGPAPLIVTAKAPALMALRLTD